MAQPVVMIVSDDAEFTGTVVARWQIERITPAFVMIGSRAWDTSRANECDLAILGPASPAATESALKSFVGANVPVVMVSSSAQQMQGVRREYPAVLVMREREGCAEAVVLLAAQALKRAEAAARAERAEHELSDAQLPATVGRFMLEMRHTMNNALTSVLGNSELLLLDPEALPAQAREHLEIIHSMGLRLHDVVQRMSALEAEARYTAAKSVLPSPAQAPVEVASAVLP